ncbi:phosphatidylinositol-specific phospholipase C/glycerophosphodiester phosphodiesterase family protein [Mucilaginibacter sp. RS28]|uniref:Altered inheritance of mitochondria protein 6 n=1 Tax=Mucilaginibacter straminoryzae TaxID=2932774 RepID=A0A9X2BBQ0_9SPHI|nr:phosphatidylinositol-specific phospholipase C/glycerophosphodiester phosphodiesterase family protein [Mucilaginibacter straminoryzae]MCJ8208503.1 phosphatidylinositol-specific phospholipase C/glycerophosphodiester phosphodiesterase family protein [Mucilaginibacter straminoryzae]
MQIRKIIVVMALAVVWAFSSKAQVTPLSNAFAHNDYWHKRPLFDALSNGYTNVEADVYLYHNRLVVTHILPILHHGRTLEDLYLKPLAEHISQHNGKVYENYDHPIILMIDIKSDANKTYALLKPLLKKYESILTGYQNGELVTRQVKVVISGHKPYEPLLEEKDRLAFIDEDLRKVTADTTGRSTLFTMASCKYSKLLNWKGKGILSIAQKNRLCNYVNEAHQNGVKVRLWASPDNQKVWQQLLQCGVDLINTDKLSRLRSFLVTNNNNNTPSTTRL